MTAANLTRRHFIQTASAAALSASLHRRAQGANERIGLGIIGLNGMGGGHLDHCKEMEDIDIVALCDVDSRLLETRSTGLPARPKTTQEFRHLLDMKDIDAILIAVPEHWHVLIALQALAAGKDVYVEKPVGHTIPEGRALAKTAAKSDRIVQVGLQQRSGPHWQHAIEKIHNGELGRISMVNTWNAWNLEEMRGDLGTPPDEPVPEGVDYDRWLGPAPKRPFNRGRFHNYWNFFWDYSGGMPSGWGVHLFDIVTWAMGPEIRRVSAFGGKHVIQDARETPDTLAATFDCPGYTMTYAMRHASGWRPFGNTDHGIEFLGDKATLQISRAGFHIIPEEDRATRKPSHSEAAKVNEHFEHKRNFFECVRTRNKPRVDAETGHLSAIPGHLLNIAYRSGRQVEWDSKTETITGDEEASKLLTKKYREPWKLEA